MMENFNVKPLIEDKFATLLKEHPDYTFGEILYTIITSTELGSKKERAYLMDITDKEFYTAIDKSIKKERNG